MNNVRHYNVGEDGVKRFVGMISQEEAVKMSSIDDSWIADVCVTGLSHIAKTFDFEITDEEAEKNKKYFETI